MGRVTYRNLFGLVVREIEKRTKFDTSSRYKDQSSRVSISPIVSDGRSDVNTAEAVQVIQDLLSDALPSTIIGGLEVTATTPISNLVNVSAGKGSVGGVLYTLESDTTLTIPFDDTSDIFYIVLYKDNILLERNYSSNKLTIAKIIIPNPGTTSLVQDTKDDSWNAYIVNFREYKLYGDSYGNLEEDSIELLRSNISHISASEIIGNIRLSEDLKIINTAGTLELNSDSLKLYDLDENVLAKFNQRGVYFYDANGKEMARFSNIDARVGNITIEQDSIHSVNFSSGAFGSGFRIKDTGDAEFNNIIARGKLTSSVFEKDTISAVGGNLLIMDSDILAEDMTSLDSSTLTIGGDATFAVGDILRIKDGVNDEWLEVTNIASAPTYTITRDKKGDYTSNNNPTWKKGTAIVNYGQSGEGGIFMTSSDSNSPYLDILTHLGSPWSTISTKVRLGNLAGITDADFGGALSGFGLYGTNVYLKGNILITGGSGYGNLTDIPDELADINAGEGSKLTGIEEGATVGADWGTNLDNIPAGLYQIFYQATAPSSGMNVGDYWIDSDDNKTYRYNGVTWVEIQDDDIAQALLDASNAQSTADSKIKVFKQSTPPAAEEVGDLWIDTDDGNKLYRWSTESGGDWEEVRDAGAVRALLALDTNGNVVTKILPGSNIGTPGGAGLFLGADYLGYYSGAEWKAFIDNTGNFTFKGDDDNYVSWNGVALTVRGQLNADDLVVGTIIGRTIKTAISGSRIEMDTNSLVAYDDASAEIFKILLSGADVGDVIFGDVNFGYMKWDKSLGKLLVADVESPDYVVNTTGYKLSATSGLAINTGTIQGTDFITKLMIYAMMFGS